MSQWNLAAISVGCLIIMISNQMENGQPLMVLATIFTGVCLAKFFKDLKKAKEADVRNKNSEQKKKQ